MKKLGLCLLFFLMVSSISAQKFLTREAFIKFYGSTPVEDIEAVTKQASSVIDASNNNVVFQVLLNSFTFEKALMQEHFNENYVESEKYPKSVFKGKILEEVDFTKQGTYNVTIEGSMSIHGVEKPVQTSAKIIVDGKGVKLSAVFNIRPKDYDIEIPSAVSDKIAEEMEVTVKALYKPV